MDRDRLLIYLSIFVIMGLSDAVIPVLPEFADLSQHNSGAFVSTLLFSAYFFGALITMLPFGILSERLGHKKLLLVSMVLTVTSGFLLFLADNIVLLIFARLLEGTACGAFFPSAFAVLATYKKRKQYIGEFYFLLNAGLASGVIIAGTLASINFKYGIAFFTILSIIPFGVAALNFYKGDQMAASIKKDIRVELRDKVHSSFNLMIRGPFIYIWIANFALLGANGVLLALYPEYSMHFLSKNDLGFAIGVTYVATMISSIVSPYLPLKNLDLVRIGLIVAAIGTFLAISMPFSGFILLGLGSGFAMVGLPTILSYLSNERGIIMGVYSTCSYAGLAIVPVIAGLFIVYPGFEFVFTVTALILFATIAVTGKFTSRL
ncbi:MFS family permease [Methanohalophilus levihalophilus]|uniref:MFS transporter n=1 Tax=Methanohalophilus levihalophilus TaxID=1431282 RepID=UPI001AE16AE7|nr:MFS transporter [Methanohalophilus levihalophilus]MBP2029586.1 MFS family permease [Methanohalophilus levihalophilus]